MHVKMFYPNDQSSSYHRFACMPECLSTFTPTFHGIITGEMKRTQESNLSMHYYYVPYTFTLLVHLNELLSHT